MTKAAGPANDQIRPLIGFNQQLMKTKYGILMLVKTINSFYTVMRSMKKSEKKNQKQKLKLNKQTTTTTTKTLLNFEYSF